MREGIVFGRWYLVFSKKNTDNKLFTPTLTLPPPLKGEEMRDEIASVVSLPSNDEKSYEGKGKDELIKLF